VIFHDKHQRTVCTEYIGTAFYVYVTHEKLQHCENYKFLFSVLLAPLPSGFVNADLYVLVLVGLASPIFHLDAKRENPAALSHSYIDLITRAPPDTRRCFSSFV
jgi:hypothetical protein